MLVCGRMRVFSAPEALVWQRILHVAEGVPALKAVADGRAEAPEEARRAVGVDHL